MFKKLRVWERDVVRYLLDNPEFDDTGLLTYIKGQLDLASAVQISDKKEYIRMVGETAEELKIPAQLRKEARIVTEFIDMLRLHLERKVEVQSRRLKEGDKVMFGNSEARIEKILPTFFVNFDDNSVLEVNPNTFTTAGN